jgi:hypothetical protein
MQNKKLDLKDQEQERLIALKKEVTEEVTGFKSLTKSEKQKKNENIISMIRHYIDMSDKVEDRRGRVRTFTLQTLAIWVAATILLVALYLDKDADINLIFFVVTLSILIVQILFCFYSAFIYEKQSGFRYPFLWPEVEEYGNTWKWFYYASKPIQRISTKTIKKSNTFNVTVEPYLESYREFVHECKSSGKMGYN